MEDDLGAYTDLFEDLSDLAAIADRRDSTSSGIAPAIVLQEGFPPYLQPLAAQALYVRERVISRQVLRGERRLAGLYAFPVDRADIEEPPGRFVA